MGHLQEQPGPGQAGPSQVPAVNVARNVRQQRDPAYATVRKPAAVLTTSTPPPIAPNICGLRLDVWARPLSADRPVLSARGRVSGRRGVQIVLDRICGLRVTEVCRSPAAPHSGLTTYVLTCKQIRGPGAPR